MKLNREESIIRDAYKIYYAECVEGRPDATHFGSFLAGMANALRLADTYGIEGVVEKIREELDGRESDADNATR